MSSSYGTSPNSVSLSKQLIEKEKEIIAKELKYNNALSQLNDRDLKLNYIDRQLIKLQELLSAYKVQSKALKERIVDLKKENQIEENG